MLAESVYHFIADELRKYKGDYLEIGIWDATGICFLAEKFPDRKFYAIDPFIDDGSTTHISGIEKGELLASIKEMALKNIAMYKNIVLYPVKSSEFKNKLSNISLVLIDGEHSYLSCLKDGELAIKLIGNGNGCIVFDDTQVPEVADAMADFSNQYKYRITKQGGISGATANYLKIKTQ